MGTCSLCEEFKTDDRVVYADAQVVVLTNYEPLMEGHLMVLPRRHVTNMEELSHEEAHALWKNIDHTARVLTKTFGKDCYMLWNKGSHSSLPHLHIHVMPMDMHFRTLAARGMNAPELKRVELSELQKVKEKIKPFWEKEMISSPRA